MSVVVVAISPVIASGEDATAPTPVARRVIKDLPPPFDTPSVRNQPKVIGWKAGQTPTAPDGFTVSSYGDEIENPRWIYVLPNGDTLVSQCRSLTDDQRQRYQQKRDARIEAREAAEKANRPIDDDAIRPIDVSDGPEDSSNQIMLYRDAEGDGVPELVTPFFKGLTQPFGMTVIGNTFYVAATDGVYAMDYSEGQTEITDEPRIVFPLPAGGYNQHWTRNLIATPDGKHLLVTVGSGSNIAEHGLDAERLRACILRIRRDGTGVMMYGEGIRNPVGMAFNPATGHLWTACNERDKLGDDLVNDYITSVRPGDFFGWPWTYLGDRRDPRLGDERRELSRREFATPALVPDVPVGAHTASLGLTFYTGDRFPDRYRGGAFIGQRGSWNRSELAGYRVAFVPMDADGKPAGAPEDFLGGFIQDPQHVHGRPVGVATLADGSILVADEKGNRLWRVAAE